MSQKTILITGASSGLGAHFACVLAGDGARVILAARSTGKIADRVEAIRQRASRHHRLTLAGNAFHGVGIPDCVRSGREAADALLLALAEPAAPAAA